MERWDRNPNSDEVLQLRQAALNRAWRREAPSDRLVYIEERCTGHCGDMPTDVVVAGEIIEHLRDTVKLLDNRDR